MGRNVSEAWASKVTMRVATLRPFGEGCMSVRSAGQSGTTCIAAGVVLVTSTNYVARLEHLTTTFSIPRTPTILPRDSNGAKLASGAGRYAGAGIEFDRVLAVNW